MGDRTRGVLSCERLLVSSEEGKIFGNRPTHILKLWYFGLKNNNFKVQYDNNMNVRLRVVRNEH